MDNKSFMSSLARKTNLDTKTTNALAELLLSELQNSLANLDSVTIGEFGTFSSVKKDEYISYDNVTKERLLFPPAIEVSFEPSDSINFISEKQ